MQGPRKSPVIGPRCRSQLLGGAVLAVLVAGSLAGCSSGGGRAATTTPATASTSTSTSTVPGAASGPATTLEPRVAKAYDEELHATLASLRRYWSRTYPSLYGPGYRNPTGGIYAYGPTTQIPSCAGVNLPYVVLADNAFYCPDDDFIAWDDDSLFPRLGREYGHFLLAIVLAHEWGHAIQQRTDMLSWAATIDSEQQADCFAGAWAASLGQDSAEASLMTLRDTELDQVLAGFIEFRDLLGMTPASPGAHGTAFDRIRAFQDGYRKGAVFCKGYEDERPALVQIPFRNFEERLQGGNQPLYKVIADVWPDVAAFWEKTYTVSAPVLRADAGACKGGVAAVGSPSTPVLTWCPDDDSLRYDTDDLYAYYKAHGDFGTAALLSLGLAAKERSGDGEAATGWARALCRTGAWTSTLFDAEDPAASRLSPGDIDEGVGVMLAMAPSSGEGEDASLLDAFARVDAFKNGVLGGPQACD